MKAKREIYGNESRHLERLFITTVALVAVLAAVFVKAAALGEFDWLVW